jgi:hypothetical protein
MIRFTLRLALILTLLLSGTLAATHAFPFEAPLDDLFTTTPGCRAASRCFMGIHLGSTTIDQAVAALSANPWVGQIDSRMFTQVSWTWSGKQPAFIDSNVPGSATVRDASSISLIRVKTHYTYGDIWLQLGTPEQGYAMRQPDGFVHGVYYTRYSLLAINSLTCPGEINDFWTLPVVIQFGDAYITLNDHYHDLFSQYRAC